MLPLLQQRAVAKAHITGEPAYPPPLFCFAFQRHFAKTKCRGFSHGKADKSILPIPGKRGEIVENAWKREDRAGREGEKRPCAFSTQISASGCKDFTQTLNHGVCGDGPYHTLRRLELQPVAQPERHGARARTLLLHRRPQTFRNHLKGLHL